MTGIVIVNWNGRRFLDACLEAVAAQSRPAELVIVVDNGSTDGSVAHLRSRWPSVEVVALERNLGVAAGNNAGIRLALDRGADFVLLLNNDASMRPDVLERLHLALDSGDASRWAATPKIVYRSEPERIWSAGGEMLWWKGLTKDRGTDQLDRGQFDRGEIVTYANTCCLLVRSSAFARVGLMDEAYFMYFDDSDFCGRLLRAGGRIVYVPEAVVLHDVQASSRTGAAGPNHFVVYYSIRNRPRFISRNVPGAGVRLAAHGFTIASRLVRMAQSVVAGDFTTPRVIWRALVDGYLRQVTGASYTPPRSAG